MKIKGCLFHGLFTDDVLQTIKMSGKWEISGMRGVWPLLWYFSILGLLTLSPSTARL